MMKYIINLVMMIAVAAGVLWWHQHNHTIESTAHQVMNHSTVLSKIRELNRLESTSFYLQSIIQTKKQGNWFALWQDSQKGIFVAKANVIAGLDLNKIQAKDVVVTDDTVIINLPEVEILSLQLNHIEVFDLRTGAFNLHRPDMSVLDLVQNQAKQQILQQACHNGILTHAQTQSKAQIERLFGLANVRVSVYVPAAKPACKMPKI